MSSNGIVLNQSLEEFFQTELQKALLVERLDLGGEATSYLLQLFVEFNQPEILHRANRPDETGTPALFRLYEQAQQGGVGERFQAFRHLGDVSLFVSGLFGAHVAGRRSLVGIDYYVDMGQSAYAQAATLSRQGGFGPLLCELAEKFRPLVEVLGRMAERTNLPVANDMGSLCERWLLNPESHGLRNRMFEHGWVLPKIGVAAA